VGAGARGGARPVRPTVGARRPVSRALLLLGALGALAYLIEGGLQRWSALQLETTLGASPALSGLAPKLLSGSLAAGRLLAQRFARRSGDNRLVALAGAGSAIGSGLVAAAPSAPIALLGVKVSGLGLPAAAPTRPRKAWRGSWPGASSRLHYSSIAARLPS